MCNVIVGGDSRDDVDPANGGATACLETRSYPAMLGPPPPPPAAFGLPTTVLAAVLAAQPQGISLLDQRFMLVGAARG